MSKIPKKQKKAHFAKYTLDFSESCVIILPARHNILCEKYLFNRIFWGSEHNENY